MLMWVSSHIDTINRIFMKIDGEVKIAPRQGSLNPI
jgi:hypothetical protein